MAEQEQVVDSATKGKVVVGGGTGFVGSEVCSLLRRKGYQVVVISRSQGNGKMTWDQLVAQGLPDQTVAVVNVAGHNILDKFSRWNDNFKILVRESRIKPASMLRQAIESAQNPPDSFVQVTGAGYYPFNSDEEFTEDKVVSNNSYFTKLVEDWEAAATLKPGHKTRNVFIRSGVVLGRNGGLIQQIFLPFFMGTGGRMGTGEQYMPWIHVKDLSGLILHSIENKTVRGPVNGVAPDLVTNQQFVDAFGASLHRPVFFPLPGFVFNLVFGEERAAIILGSQKVVPKKAQDTGFKFRFPTIAEACQEFSALFYTDPDSN